MTDSWIDDTYPITSVFGRTGAVLPILGDYSADKITFDSGLTIANPANVSAALDALYMVSPLGDRPFRVVADDFQNSLYVNGTTPTIVADAATIGSGATNSALSGGDFGWDATSAAADLLRETPPAGASMSGLWTIRSSGSAGGLITSRASMYPSALKRVRLACRLQVLPVAQSTAIGFFSSALTNLAILELFTLSSSVFSLRFWNSKAGVASNVVLPYSTVNEQMTMVYTLSENGTKQRAAVYNAAGNLIGPVLESTIPTANVIAVGTALKAGVYVYASGNPANTPLARIDYLEIGL